MKTHTNLFLKIANRCSVKSFDMEEIVVDHHGIEAIEKEHLKLFPNLQVIYLNGNKLTELSGLDYCIRLEIIDARNNKISHISLKSQTFLRELFLANNKIYDIDTFLQETSNLRNLEVLDLRGNPITLIMKYRNTIISKFINLKLLDGVEITRTERGKDLLVPRASRAKGTSRSMLQCLMTREVSETDKKVEIKEARKQQKIREKNEREMEAKMNFDKFGNSYLEKDMNISTQITPLSQAKNIASIDKNKGKIRAKSRIFIKTSTFEESKPVLICDDNSSGHSLLGKFHINNYSLKEKLVFSK